MNCPKCLKDSTRVIDSQRDDKVVYRRRKCAECGYTFYTSERYDDNARCYLHSIRNNNRMKV